MREASKRSQSGRPVREASKRGQLFNELLPSKDSFLPRVTPLTSKRNKKKNKKQTHRNTYTIQRLPNTIKKRPVRKASQRI